MLMISRVVVRSAEKGGTFPGPIRLVTSDNAKVILFAGTFSALVA